MKRTMCRLAALAMLMWTCPPAQAEYLGELRRDVDWQLQVDNSSSAGKTAVTVHYLIGRSGEKEISRDDIEIGLVAGGARTQLIYLKARERCQAHHHRGATAREHLDRSRSRSRSAVSEFVWGTAGNAWKPGVRRRRLSVRSATGRSRIRRSGRRRPFHPETAGYFRLV